MVFDPAGLAADLQYLTAMSTTVAVALITSLSTLCGGVIGSATSLILSNSQSHKDKLDKRREIRRDAYVQLLNKFDGLVVLLDKCWMTQAPPKYAEVSAELLAVQDGLYELENATNAVQLEGPAEIIEVARPMYQLPNEEFNAQLKITSQSQGSDRIARFQLSDGKCYELGNAGKGYQRRILSTLRERFWMENRASGNRARREHRSPGHPPPGKNRYRGMA